MMLIHCNQGHENQTGSRFCLYCGEPLWLPVGHILEKRYRIVRQLSAGGFGRTYLAEDLHRFNEQCVLKEFAPQVKGARELQKAKELFEREAGALYKLFHPQVPKFREFFEAKHGGGVSCLFLAQDYVEGQTYSVLLSRGRLSEVEVTRLLYQLLPVLSYIHTQGVIHRDISPDNLMLRSSDQRPVLIDFGGVKLAATVVSKATQGHLPTRLGKKGYAPEEQLLQGQVFPSSDLYALAVTALVLLTGKEPQELYDSYKGWCQREIRISSQLETVLQKMLAYKLKDRYQSADEVLQDLQSPPSSPPSSNSQIRTINFVGQKPEPNASYSNKKSGTQVIAIPTFHLDWVRPWAVRAVVAGLVVLMGMSALPLINSVIRKIQSLPVALRSPNAASTAAITKELLSRRQALGVKETFFNSLVDNSFYQRHPELQRRSLKSDSEDAALQNDWYNIAEELLDKLEQAELSYSARRKLGSYSQEDYEVWKQQANQGQLGSYTIEKLTQQTDRSFYKLFPQQQREKLKLQTFGQIWYAIAADKVERLKTGK